MTPEYEAIFDSIAELIHRKAMKIAELPKEERAAALQDAHRSIVAKLGTTEPELIEICVEGIATILRQIDSSGRPSGGHA